MSEWLSRWGLDPHGSLFRRAARVALVMPTVLVVVGWLGGGLAMSFATFGAFALLVFADFGGPPARRLRAYLVTTAVGCALIVLGTLTGLWLALGIVTAFVVGFCVAFSALLRGYVAAGGPAVQLMFVLAVTLGASPGELPDELMGWLVGAGIATAAALLLWPSHRRSALRPPTAAALRAAATLVRARWMDGDEAPTAALADVRSRVDTVRETYGSLPFRPAGATSRDRAFMQLVDELERIRTFLVWAITARRDDLRHGAGTPGDAALATATATALDRAAATIEGTDAFRRDDAAMLLAAREHHRDQTAQWIESQAAAAHRDAGVLRVVARSYALRVTSFLASLAALDAAAAEGHGPGGESLLVRHTPRSAWAILRVQFTSSSPWFRNSLRAGTGVALAVAVALLLEVQHAFWVVLALLSVLRFDALGTGRTAMQAIGGTVAGFVVGSSLVWLIGANLTVLWILVPVTAFVAAWAPSQFPFPVGQASFTLFVIVMFGVVSYPPELTIGVVRVEDVLLGAAVGVVVGLLFWPRGIVPKLERVTAQAYRDASDYLVAAIRGLSGGLTADDVTASQRRADESASLANETFELALMARGPGLPNADGWARQTYAAAHVVAVADLVTAIGSLRPPISPCPGSADPLVREAEETRGLFAAVAATLDGADRTGVDRIDVEPTPDDGPPPEPPHSPLLDCAIGCLGHLGAGGTGPTGGSVAVVVWVHDWLVHLDWVGRRAAPPPPGLRTSALTSRH